MSSGGHYVRDTVPPDWFIQANDKKLEELGLKKPPPDVHVAGQKFDGYTGQRK